jgi:hypothetical protein
LQSAFLRVGSAQEAPKVVGVPVAEDQRVNGTGVDTQRRVVVRQVLIRVAEI